PSTPGIFQSHTTAAISSVFTITSATSEDSAVVTGTPILSATASTDARYEASSSTNNTGRTSTSIGCGTAAIVAPHCRKEERYFGARSLIIIQTPWANNLHRSFV